MTTRNIPLRFGRGGGLMLSANEKGQAGYLKLNNSSLDQRDVVEKRTGAVEVALTVNGQDDIVPGEQVAMWYRDDEGPVLETINTLYSRRMCDAAPVSGESPSGDWVPRGTWTRSTLRTQQLQDWAGTIVRQSTAALVTSSVGGVAEPCVLSLAELNPAGNAELYATLTTTFLEDGELPNAVPVLGALVAGEPHIAAVTPTKLAYTLRDATGGGMGDIRFQLWQPGDAITDQSAPTGINVGASAAVHDLTGVVAGDGMGYMGIIAVEGMTLRVQIRDETGAVVDDETLTPPAGWSGDPPLLCAIYGIPDGTELAPQFVTVGVWPNNSASTTTVVDVFETTGSGLSFRWQALRAAAPTEGTPRAVTCGALVSQYKLFALTALERVSLTTGEHSVHTEKWSQASGMTTPGGFVTNRNSVFASMIERNGLLMLGMTAIALSQDRTKRTGLFLERGELSANGETEVMGRVDFLLPEDFVSRASRNQVSDLNGLGTENVIGYQVETARTVVQQAMGATRSAVFDFASTANKPAVLQEVAISAHAGYPRAYDGVRAYEQDWHELPQILELTPGDGNIAAGTVGVAVTWGAYDGNTLFYRSQPDFENIALAGGTGFDVVARSIQRTERLTVDLEVWTTQLNGAVYGLATRVDAKVITGIPGSDTITVNIAALIAPTELLDQTPAGTRPSQPTSITDFVGLAGERLWGPDPFRGSLVRFTIPFSEGNAPHWPLVQGVEVEGARRVTALSPMDGRIIMWTAVEAHTLAGAGPTGTGIGSFGQPRLIPSSTGCSGQPTVALTPDGLVYGSGASPHILTRGLTAQEYADMIYRPYETDGETVKASIWRPIERITTLVNGASGRSFSFSPETVRWEEDTGRQAKDLAISSKREVAWLLGDGRVLVEPPLPANERPYADGDTGYQFLISTPWIHQPGAGALHSVFSFVSAQIWGDYLGAHELQCRVYFDYSTTPDWTAVVTAATTAANEAAGIPYLYEVSIAQACFAIRLEFSDNAEKNQTFRCGGIDVVIDDQGSTMTPNLKEAQGFRKV